MILLWIFVAVLSIYMLIGWTICRIVFHRNRNKKHSIQIRLDSPLSFRADREWLDAQPVSHITINADDGLKLHASFIEKADANRIAVCCHGYHSRGTSLSEYAKLFDTLGFSILLPDARAHGQSEGNYTGMGYCERRDLIRWLLYLQQHFPDRKVLLFGVSMGGATVMNALGEKLPDNVVCAIEDCGYSDLNDVLCKQMRKRHIPPILLYCAEPFCRMLCHCSILDRKSTIEALRRSQTPLLLIHGGSDSLVPHEQMHTAESNCSAYHKTLSIPGADHAASITAAPNIYRSTIETFVNLFFDAA